MFEWALSCARSRVACVSAPMGRRECLKMEKTMKKVLIFMLKKLFFQEEFNSKTFCIVDRYCGSVHCARDCVDGSVGCATF